MDNDAHYYAEGYGAENDPYVQDNGVLINKLGLKDFKSLNEIEADLAGIEVKRLVSEVLPSSFDLAYLCFLHEQIFQHIYPWAGKFRQVDIGKGDTLFLAHHKIAEEIGTLFADLAAQQFFKYASVDAFSQLVGQFLVRLNFIHPFREGNGRVQRLFVLQLARNAGIDLDWSAVGNDAMKRACIEGIKGNTREMVRLILLNSKRAL